MLVNGWHANHIFGNWIITEMLFLEFASVGPMLGQADISTLAQRRDYTTNPVKSVIAPFNMKSQLELDHLRESSQIQLNSKALRTFKDDATHVGIQPNCLKSDPCTLYDNGDKEDLKNFLVKCEKLRTTHGKFMCRIIK